VAIVQISKIQIRRGRKNQGEGLPQLASGELGWAVDTQELFIGNGSLIEGAPAVGNTKILTQYDDIFALTKTYTYKDESSIITGESPETPIQRRLKDRLDDRVSVRAFGVSGIESDDATGGLQRAIDQLFLGNTQISPEVSRVELFIEPGVYSITDTIYLPSFTQLIGAGPNRTVIKKSTPGPIFMTVNDNSTIGNPAINPDNEDAQSTFHTQPKNIVIKGLSLLANQDTIGLHLSSCRDSIIDNVHIQGNWNEGDEITTISQFGEIIGTGILLDSLSLAVTTNNNRINNCKIGNWQRGVVANQKVNNNHFTNCHFVELGEGVIFGAQYNGDGEHPTNTKIDSCNFENISNEAIAILQGSNNVSQNNIFTKVGNSFGGEFMGTHHCIFFNTPSNKSINDFFARTENLSTNYLEQQIPYISEIGGNVTYDNIFDQEVTINTGNGAAYIRIPIDYFAASGAENSYMTSTTFGAFVLNYSCVNESFDFKRVGKLIINFDNFGNDKFTLVDEYEQIGDSQYESPFGNDYAETDIKWSASIIDEGSGSGSEITNYVIYLFAATEGLQTSSKFRFRISTTKHAALI